MERVTNLSRRSGGIAPPTSKVPSKTLQAATSPFSAKLTEVDADKIVKPIDVKPVDPPVSVLPPGGTLVIQLLLKFGFEQAKAYALVKELGTHDPELWRAEFEAMGLDEKFYISLRDLLNEINDTNPVDPTDHPDFTYAHFVDNFYSMWLTGASGNLDLYGMGWGIPTRGYNNFFDTYIAESIEKGVKKTHIHLPHGTSGGPMQFDMLLEAQDSGKTFAYEGFYENLESVYQNHPDHRFLLYFGSIRLDAYFKDALTDGRARDWFKRAVDSIAPALAARNVDIGFDAPMGAPSTYDQEGPVLQFIRTVRALKKTQGCEVYVEPRQHFDAPMWHDFNVLSIESFWNRSNPDRYADSARWAIRNQDIRAKVIRMEASRPPVDSNNRPLDWRAYIPQRITNVMIDNQDGQFPYQYSHGLVRSMIFPDGSTGATYGPLAENMREIYDETIAYAQSVGSLSTASG